MLFTNAIIPRKILCLGAHSDDIEIGCGGTLRRLIAERPGIEIWWQVFSATGERKREAEASAADFLAGVKERRIVTGEFRESYFPQDWALIKDEFEHLKQEFEPDLILTHWRDDRHQDHRVLSDLAWNTFRNHTILEYEIPKYDGDLGQPNYYVTLDESICRGKVTAILQHFRSQASRAWFTEDTFFALMRLRGIECGARARFAEAFHARKLVV
ncbi:MAG TPA: PIG-L deacetylase family protein [Verrucomicrobiae bacterium]|nr:PIG-L deacetylase family protein [Verrucomicrobiae bacterium]